MKPRWKLAEAPAIEAIRQAQSSSRIVMETLRLWAEIQALDSMPAAETGHHRGRSNQAQAAVIKALAAVRGKTEESTKFSLTCEEAGTGARTSFPGAAKRTSTHARERAAWSVTVKHKGLSALLKLWEKSAILLPARSCLSNISEKGPLQTVDGPSALDRDGQRPG